MIAFLCVACSPSVPEVEGRDASQSRAVVAGCTNSPYATIQDAIDASRTGDIVYVCAGTYDEHLTISGKAIALRGISGAASTVVDAQGLDRALEVETGSAVIIEGFTFRNGYSPTGTGGNVACRGSASITIRDSVLERGEAENGGGFGTWTCTGVIERTDFVLNSAVEQGGGVYGDAGLVLRDNLFQANDALEGGGAYLWDSMELISGNTFIENTSVDDGGGLFVHRGAPTIDANTFERNESDEEAGGLRVKAAEGFITNNVLVENYASWRGGGSKISHDEVEMWGNTWIGNVSGSDAGALLLLESASVLTDEVYRDNEADDEGGAIVIVEGWGSVTIQDSYFENNAADRGGHLYIDLLGYETRLRRVGLIGGTAEQGGAVYATSESLLELLLADPYTIPAYSAVDFENTLFEDNVADLAGGALYLYGVDGVVLNSLLIDNQAPVGAAMDVVSGRPLFGVTNTIFDGQLGGAAVQLELGWAPTLTYNAFHGNVADTAGMASVIGRNGNVDDAPGFVDETIRDYHLTASSPLIDEGDPDIDDADGTRSDIGLYGGPRALP